MNIFNFGWKLLQNWKKRSAHSLTGRGYLVQTGRDEKEVNFTCSEVHFFFLSVNCYEGPSLKAEEKEEVHISSMFLQEAFLTQNKV